MRIAFATDLNEGLSSLLRTVDSCLANVEDSHFLTSSGTASDWSSERSSGASSLFWQLQKLYFKNIWAPKCDYLFFLWFGHWYSLFCSSIQDNSTHQRCIHIFCPFIHILLFKGVISLKLLGKHIHRNTLYGNRCSCIWTYMKMNLYLVLRKLKKKVFFNCMIFGL